MVDEELVGAAPEVMDRLAVYFADVASGLPRSEQRRNAELYARGLMAAGARKSLEPMVARLGGGNVEYEATLPQTVLLLQPVFQCWTGRCTTCQQPVNLTHLPLRRPPQQE